MRYVIILILLLIGSNAHAQFSPIPINTTEHIGRMIYMGDRILVACNPSWYSVDTNLQSTTELNIPPPYSANIIHKQGANLYLLKFTLGPGFQYYISYDTGANWVLRYQDPNFYAMQHAVFDSLNIIVFGMFNERLRSTDGGYTWIVEAPSNKTQLIKVYDSSTLVSSGHGVSYDKATNWKSLCPLFLYYYDLNLIGHDSVFSTYIDVGGASYVSASSDTCNTEYKRFMGDTLLVSTHISKHGIYCPGMYRPTGEGVIYKTTDFGRSFTMYNTHIKKRLHGIYLINDSTALVSGEDGTLLKWRVDTQGWPVGISPSPEGEAWGEVLVYPNPASSVLELRLSKAMPHRRVTLYNILGEQVYTQELATAALQHRIDVSSYPRGMYILRCGGQSKGVVLE